MSGFMLTFAFDDSKLADTFVSEIITTKNKDGVALFHTNIIINPDCTISVIVKGIKNSQGLELVENLYDTILENGEV